MQKEEWLFSKMLHVYVNELPISLLSHTHNGTNGMVCWFASEYLETRATTLI